jgi:hypothetical protein
MGHAKRMGEMKYVYKFWSENLKGRDNSEDLGVDGVVIWNGSYGNTVGRSGLDVSDSG